VSYNGSGTFQINTSGQPVVAGTVISSTAFNALTADLATGLSTAITKDGQTTTTARIPFAAGISSTLTTDSTSTTTGSIITAGGVGIVKNLYVGANTNIAGTLGVTGVATFSAAPIYSSLTASSAVATDASKNLVSVTNTGTGNNVLATSPTLVTPVLGVASATSITVDAGAVGTPSITTTGDTNTGIFFPAADTIAFAEGGVESMRIDSSGNLNFTGTAQRILGDFSNATTASRVAFQSSTTNGFTGLAVLPNGTSTTSFLQLWNNSDPTNAGQFSFVAGTADARMQAAISGSGSYVPLTMYTGGSERVRIDTSGNLLVGTTSDPGGSARVGIKGSGTTISTVSLYIINSSSVGNFLVYDNGAVNTGTTSAGSPYNNTTGTAANAVVSADGFLRRSTSSLRYKTDIQDATHGLTDLLKLRSVTYKGKNDGDIIFGGLIAEEVDAAGLNEFVQYAADGSPDALAYGNMVSLCVKAIQEQQALITALTARITALEAK
jgi:hypothetical protein